MDRNESLERLSRIETQWSALIEANRAETNPSILARGHLMQRYCAAVYRYLLGAVRDPDVAEELGQEFALRFLRGDFRRANPERGKFRNYVKSVLINLVNDHFRAKAKQPRNLNEEAFEPVHTDSIKDTEDDFLTSWRTGLLDRTWYSLNQANTTFHATLLLRIEQPDVSSREMAEELSKSLEKPMTAAGVRKTLERAHIKFADLLLDEIALSIESDDLEMVRRELETLDLLKYCRTALERKEKKQGR